MAIDYSVDISRSMVEKIEEKATTDLVEMKLFLWMPIYVDGIECVGPIVNGGQVHRRHTDFYKIYSFILYLRCVRSEVSLPS